MDDFHFDSPTLDAMDAFGAPQMAELFDVYNNLHFSSTPGDSLLLRPGIGEHPLKHDLSPLTSSAAPTTLHPFGATNSSSSTASTAAATILNTTNGNHHHHHHNGSGSSFLNSSVLHPSSTFLSPPSSSSSSSSSSFGVSSLSTNPAVRHTLSHPSSSSSSSIASSTGGIFSTNSNNNHHHHLSAHQTFPQYLSLSNSSYGTHGPPVVSSSPSLSSSSSSLPSQDNSSASLFIPPVTATIGSSNSSTTSSTRRSSSRTQARTGSTVPDLTNLQPPPITHSRTPSSSSKTSTPTALSSTVPLSLSGSTASSAHHRRNAHPPTNNPPTNNATLTGTQRSSTLSLSSPYGNPTTSTMIDDNEENGPSGTTGTTTSKNKKRFLWTEDLHMRFIAAIFDYGLENVTPKLLYSLMENTCPSEMTSDHIKSHLQKFRNNSRTGKELFLRDFERARSIAETRAREEAQRTGQPPFPVHFSTYPIPPPSILRGSGYNETGYDGCDRCDRYTNLIELGIGNSNGSSSSIGNTTTATNQGNVNNGSSGMNDPVTQSSNVPHSGTNGFDTNSSIGMDMMINSNVVYGGTNSTPNHGHDNQHAKKHSTNDGRLVKVSNSAGMKNDTDTMIGSINNYPSSGSHSQPHPSHSHQHSLPHSQSIHAHGRKSPSTTAGLPHVPMDTLPVVPSSVTTLPSYSSTSSSLLHTSNALDVGGNGTGSSNDLLLLAQQQLILSMQRLAAIQQQVTNPSASSLSSLSTDHGTTTSIPLLPNTNTTIPSVHSSGANPQNSSSFLTQYNPVGSSTSETSSSNSITSMHDSSHHTTSSNGGSIVDDEDDDDDMNDEKNDNDMDDGTYKHTDGNNLNYADLLLQLLATNTGHSSSSSNASPDRQSSNGGNGNTDNNYESGTKNMHPSSTSTTGTAVASSMPIGTTVDSAVASSSSSVPTGHASYPSSSSSTTVNRMAVQMAEQLKMHRAMLHRKEGQLSLYGALPSNGSTNTTVSSTTTATTPPSPTTTAASEVQALLQDGGRSALTEYFRRIFALDEIRNNDKVSAYLVSLHTMGNHHNGSNSNSSSGTITGTGTSSMVFDEGSLRGVVMDVLGSTEASVTGGNNGTAEDENLAHLFSFLKN